MTNTHTKSSFELATKHMMNGIRTWNGINNRWRGWDKNVWQIVDGTDFDTAKTIKDFYLRNDLWDYLKTNSSNQPNI